MDNSIEFCKDGDTISINLDLKNKTLSYTINDIDCGIAFDDVEP